MKNNYKFLFTLLSLFGLLFVFSCKEEEQNRVLNYQKGVYLGQKDQDPLIDLKQQEINLRAQEIKQNKENADKKLELDVEKLNFEGEKLQQKDEMDKEKIQSQEDQAQLRAEVALKGQKRQKG